MTIFLNNIKNKNNHNNRYINFCMHMLNQIKPISESWHLWIGGLLSFPSCVYSVLNDIISYKCNMLLQFTQLSVEMMNSRVVTIRVSTSVQDATTESTVLTVRMNLRAVSNVVAQLNYICLISISLSSWLPIKLCWFNLFRSWASNCSLRVKWIHLLRWQLYR